MIHVLNHLFSYAVKNSGSYATGIYAMAIFIVRCNCLLARFFCYVQHRLLINVKRLAGSGGTRCWDLTANRRRSMEFDMSLTRTISCVEGIPIDWCYTFCEIKFIMYFVVVYSVYLSPIHTVAEKGDCRRKVRQYHFCATVSLFCDSVDRALENISQF